MRFKAHVCGRLIVRITSSNSAESLDVLEFVVCCVVAVWVTSRSLVRRSLTGRVCLILFDV